MSTKYNLMDTNDITFRLKACEYCTKILRDKVNTQGNNEYNILREFQSKYLPTTSIEDIKEIIGNIYFTNLANDKYGKNNLVQGKEFKIVNGKSR